MPTRLALSAASLLLPLAVACGAAEKPEPKTPVLVAAPAAPAEDPDLVALEGALGNRYLETDKQSEVLAHLRITTRSVEDGQRPALNLALAIDTSGSMSGAGIENARAAAASILDQLQPGDRLSVVVFHSKTEVLLPVTTIEDGKLTEIRDRIAAMKASGTTDMATGLGTAINLAVSARIPDGVNRVVLLSDGVPNDPTNIVPLAQNAAQNHVAITTMGLGLEYDETLLAQVARSSGGSFHFIEKPEAVAKVFREEVLRMQRVVARNLNMTLVPGPGVDIREVLGFDAAMHGNRGRYVGLGELSQDQELDLVVRLAVTGHRSDATVELLDATLRFDDAVAGAGTCERDLFLAATATSDPDRLREGANPEIQQMVTQAVLAAATVQAISYARGGNLAAAQQILDRAEPQARQAAETYDAPEFLATADDIAELRRSLPALAPAPPPPQPSDAVPASIDEAPIAAVEEVPETAPATIRRSHSRANDNFQPRPRNPD